MYEQYFIYPS